jgi:hypothetical protein
MPPYSGRLGLADPIGTTTPRLDNEAGTRNNGPGLLRVLGRRVVRRHPLPGEARRVNALDALTINALTLQLKMNSLRGPAVQVLLQRDSPAHGRMPYSTHVRLVLLAVPGALLRVFFLRVFCSRVMALLPFCSSPMGGGPGARQVRRDGR